MPSELIVTPLNGDCPVAAYLHVDGSFVTLGTVGKVCWMKIGSVVLELDQEYRSCLQECGTHVLEMARYMKQRPVLASLTSRRQCRYLGEHVTGL